MNRFEVIGNLAERPQERRLPSGTRVANARLGQSYTFETKDGPKQHTNWFSLAFYGEMVTTALKLEKGDRLNIVGTFEQRQFTPKDGATRNVYEVIVKECKIASRPEPSILKTTAIIAGLPEPSESRDAWSFI